MPVRFAPDLRDLDLDEDDTTVVDRSRLRAGEADDGSDAPLVTHAVAGEDPAKLPR